jgi:hypothetical protein
MIKYEVASISLKAICEQIQVKRLNLMNLDVVGYGAAALQTNDWTNPKCRPEIIVT